MFIFSAVFIFDERTENGTLNTKDKTLCMTDLYRSEEINVPQVTSTFF